MEGQEVKPEAPEETKTEAPPPAEAETNEPDAKGNVIGSPAIRPIFLGNLRGVFEAEQVSEVFTKPIIPPDLDQSSFKPFPVDRVDVKRGFCFVFLKDAASQADKDDAERFVSAINGMEVPNLSSALRVEFARGDGRIKKKEDDRRKNIQPSETLFVVNFHEETTKREDLQMLFEPFGELVRIDMKRNYAFVQFRSVDDATKAKETTDGGKLDQSVLTVEFVARRRQDDSGRRRRRDGGPRGGDRRGGGRDYRGGPSDRYDRGYGDRYDRDRHDRGYGGDRYDARGRGRDRSPPGGYRGASPAGYARRSRSRSRSPRGGVGGYRSRSPPRRSYDDRDRGRYDDYRDNGRRGWSPENYRGRGSPDRGYGRP
ncbi:unnamed protein product [Cylindrotheca closterium]|uniref:RRM domain-containing protein n=1 Tax=Cylindrotheca closterium TaxID=2856 RepID=A0AAD2FZ31_9STRA|nr:unnamed protein product [Cylindrotheca closterium]